MTRRRRSLAPLLASAAVALLAGCSNETELYTPAESPKTVKLDWVHFDHLVAFQRGGDALAPDSRVRLDAFVARAAPGYGDEVLVGPGVVPPAYAREAAARTGAVLTELRAQGVDAHAAPPEYAGVSWDGAVRVIVGRYLIHTPNCPDWTKPADGDPLNNVHSNFGCATASNLDLMVANPADLVHGRDMSPADGDKEARAFRVYRALNQYAPPMIPPNGTLEKVPQDLVK